MRKIDFHIHTISTTKDIPFEFDINSLKSYVNFRSLDAIAITNHNIFDEAQFHEIKDAIDCIVFPGIEIDLDKGHVLVVAPVERITRFNSECARITSLLSNCKSLSVSDFLEFFPNLSEYLIIPHYKKDPQIPASIIQQLAGFIIAGEVDSPKKWERCHKDLESLTPVLFSDMRSMNFQETKREFSTRQTFLDIDEISIQTLQVMLKDRQKVFLDENQGCSSFRLSNDDVLASTGLNVIIGKRSSGKSYTLQSIANDYPDCSKYIKQFSLVDKNTDEEFNEIINKRHNDLSYKYLSELRSIIERLQTIDYRNLQKNLTRFVQTLKSYADSESMSDVFSQSKLFSEISRETEDLKPIRKVIEATLTLLETEEFLSLITSIIPQGMLITLFKELTLQYRSLAKRNKLISIVNDCVMSIKDGLASHSSREPISDVDFSEVTRAMYSINLFDALIEKGARDRVVETLEVGEFVVRAQISAYKNTSELKKELRTSKSLEEVKKLSPFTKLKILQTNNVELGIELGNLYKAFWKITYEVKNKDGFDLSGGEKSEFNLIRALEDAALYDIVLIDEIESSFDNLFLNDQIVKLMRKLSHDSSLFLVTHNNTLGLMLKPNCILYTEKVINEGIPRFKIYSGTLSSKYLLHKDGTKVPNYYTLLSTMEAGEDAYLERRQIYEGVKN